MRRNFAISGTAEKPNEVPAEGVVHFSDLWVSGSIWLVDGRTIAGCIMAATAVPWRQSRLRLIFPVHSLADRRSVAPWIAAFATVDTCCRPGVTCSHTAHEQRMRLRSGDGRPNGHRRRTCPPSSRWLSSKRYCLKAHYGASVYRKPTPAADWIVYKLLIYKLFLGCNAVLRGARAAGWPRP